MKINPLTLIDWYKADHRRQYPEGTTLVFSNMTPRKSRIDGVKDITFFGLQYFIKEYLIDLWNENFFNRSIASVIKDWNRRKDTSLGPNDIGEDHIRALHDLGYLPLQIMALPEGSIVPIKVPPFVLWNTHPDFFWLVNHMETIMSASTWQSSTSATLAREYHKLFTEASLRTVGNTDFVQWQGHDFSFRGMSSLESACMSGAAHLLYFTGTDTIPAIDFLEEYYNANADKELIGGSIPATEHSVMCMGGKESEIETYRRLLKLYPTGPFAVVSDTWDYWKVLTEILPLLKDEIIARDGKLVIRPDSGDPVDIICGYPTVKKLDFYEIMKLKCNHFIHEGKAYDFDREDYEEWRAVGGENADLDVNDYIYESEKPNHVVKGSIEVLWDLFGGTISAKGYKVLDSHIGLIYGDSITLERARVINARLESKGFASINWVAGIGSYTYQMNTRDTLGWAVKATYGELGEETREIFKSPATDDGTKKSAKGLIAVYQNIDGTFRMKDQATWDEVKNCAFQTVFYNSESFVDQRLSDIRKLAKSY